jgi:serine/threonine-protein kinase
MTPERWRRIETLYREATALEGDARAEYLKRQCGDDPALLAEVEALLREDGCGDRTIAEAIGRAASEVVESQAGALIGKRLGVWRLAQCIAHGGMGSVYLAERCDGQFEQRAAVKLLNPALLSPDALARFNGERQILARLSHSNIARLYDGGTTEEGVPYLVMEYIEGSAIGLSCAERRLGTRARLELFMKVCAAVDYAHRNLVVHRDIKPSNILVDALGEPKLLDFGVAKLIDREHLARTAVTVADLRALTPRYASPEQLKGETITTATDVYSLGVLLYELLSGRSPYGDADASPRDLHEAILGTNPQRPSAAVGEAGGGRVAHLTPERLRRELSGDLDNIVLMALRKEPERRYGTARQLAEDIARHLSDQPVLARPDTLSYRAGKFLRRHRAMATVAAAAATALLALGVLHTQRVATERDRALRAERMAREEADTARAVTDFLVGTFSAVDPVSLAPKPDITARELLDRGVASLQAADAGSGNVTRRVGLTMSRAYAGLGLTAPARDLAQRALAEIEGARIGDSRELADAHDALARVSALEDQWQQARVHGERALEIYERLTAPDSPEVANILTRLSGIYLMLDALDEHVHSAERALEILEKTKGPNAVETQDATAALANAYVSSGKWEQALLFNQRALAGYARLLGQNHLKVAAATHVRTRAMYMLGRYREALALAQQEHEILNAVVGPDDVRQARAYRMMYINYNKLGDAPNALRSIKRAIAINEAAPSPSLTDLHIAYGNLGKLLLDEGFPDAAEPWFDRSREILRRLYAPDHSEFAYPYMFYGILAYKRGKYDSARDYLDRAVAVDLKLYPPEHVEVLKKRIHREYVELLAGNAARAAAGLEEIVAILDRTVGPEHPVSAQAVGCLAEANDALGKDAAAETQFQRALATIEKQQGTANVPYFDTLRAYATFVRRARGVESAKPLFDRLAGLEAKRTPLRASDLS